MRSSPANKTRGGNPKKNYKVRSLALVGGRVVGGVDGLAGKALG